MANDKQKGKGLEVAQLGASLVGLGPVAAAFKAIGLAARQYRDRRLESMWSSALTGQDDPLAFAQTVEQRLLEGGGAIADGFVAAAQAAADAISLSVVPSIGLLAGRYLASCEPGPPSPSRREFRTLLGLLRELDDEELGALRSAVHRMLRINADVFTTTILKDEAHGQFVWYCADAAPPITELVVGPAAIYIVNALAPLTSQTVSPGHRPAFDNQKPMLARPIVQLLADIMPLELQLPK